MTTMSSSREMTSPISAPVTIPDQNTNTNANIPVTSHPLSMTPRDSGEGNRIDSESSEMVHVRALIISGQSHVFSFEPETTVGRTKELIWSMWPSDWTSPAQPPSPSFLRILHAGRILQDDTTLSSNNLPTATSTSNPTVIHISVRSFSIRAEDDPKPGSKLGPSRTRSRGGEAEEVGGCKCIIM